ncbi:hypothetical protein [Empedobacter sedimenti]|uniref:hypothetical protein n=1 Tax=Empedobacter sedimenti TaxID=3042610 RepID=UPI0024A7542B|nr:hypothetical protein [Empedobacter sedimenti]
MNIKVHIFFVLSLFSILSHSQVGINTKNPAPSSLLDVVSNEKGILIPRLTTLERDRIDKPSNGLLIYDKENQCLSQNIGNDITPEWVCLGITTRFFYMPSMVIDTSNVGTTKQIDLFSIYKNQFENPMVKSENAKSSIPYFSNAQKLYYYITYYDNSVIDQITIDENGLMKYLVKGTPSEVSFMNVVFVVK